MNDFDFRGLSSRSFEQLVQAIALKAIGPGVTIFGDGPDGGREATFIGKVPFPSAVECWDGYGVLQAKFKIRPSADGRDGKWLATELTKELDKYLDPTKQIRCPDYFILCTNVILTAVSNTGTKDIIGGIFDEYKTRLPFRDYRIWDYDQLAGYIRGYADIRRSYLAWITAGDVLYEAIQVLKPSQLDFENTIANFLQKEFVADLYANLEQAGHSVEEQTPLATVFVDLPAYKERLLEPPRRESKGRHGIVHQIVDAASWKLSPSADIKLVRSQNGDQSRLGRYVVIGGPGQGKTTIGQFIAQLFRATILSRRKQETLVYETRQALTILADQCEKEEVSSPSGARFPLRIVLNRFATALAGNDPNLACSSLFEYLVKHIARLTNRTVTGDDFRAWLGLYPWVLILDGLDEVPTSSNRDDVLTAIQNFWIDAAASDADVLVLATTRPQGYNDEFSTQTYQHLWLAPLSNNQALHYAQRLVDERHRTDSERREKIMGRLRRAADNEATSRLMRSPLQVTILAALVDQIGQAPRDRWRLFHEYYGVIYRRETERNTPAASLLSDYRKDIDAIHERTALILQAESERRGGTSAELTIEQFASIVEDRLVAVGHEGEFLKTLKAAIIAAAEQRLVFVVGVSAKRYGFEIRSLQEFMAAEALVRDSDDLVIARINEIAPISNWRNVFLMAAGKCISERDYLFEIIFPICCKLNDYEYDRSLGVTLAGARLALEILEDGLVATQPHDARLFAREAMRLLALPLRQFHERLAAAYEPALDNVYREIVTTWIKATESKEHFGAWRTLVALIERGVPWARELGESSWCVDVPTNLVDADRLRFLSPEQIGGWLFEKVIAAAKMLGPQIVYQLLYRVFRQPGGAGAAVPQWLREAMQIYVAPVDHINVMAQSIRIDCEHGVFSLPLRSVQFRGEKFEELFKEDLPPIWTSTLAIARFCAVPSAHTLAQELGGIAERFEAGDTFLPRATGFPWPLAAVLAKGTNAAELKRLANFAAQGAFGDYSDWVRAEVRWSKKSFSYDEIDYEFQDGLPYDSSIGVHGVPWFGNDFADPSEANAETISDLIAAIGRLSSKQRRGELYRCLLDSFSEPGFVSFPQSLCDSDLISMLSQIDDPSVIIVGLLYLKDVRAALVVYGEKLCEIGRRSLDEGVTREDFSVSDGFRANAQSVQAILAQYYREHTSEHGLLVFMAILSTLAASPLADDLRFAFFEGGTERGLIAIIKIGSGHWTEADIPQFTHALTEVDSAQSLIWPVITMLRDSDQPGKSEALLQSLLMCPKMNRMFEGSLIEGIDHLVLCRSSGFTKSATWSRLRLPSVLADISQAMN